MVKCHYCEEEIEYLPFNCRYCGHKYCKKHRIPENHNCTFENMERIKVDEEKNTNVRYVGNINRNPPNNTRRSFGDNYLRSSSGRSSPFTSGGSFISSISNLRGYHIVIILNLLFYILGFIFNAFSLLQFFYIVPIYYIPPFYTYYTILTSLFIPTIPSISTIFTILFIFLIIWFTGRSIEMKFGKSNYLKIYLVGAIMTAGSILILSFILSVIPQFTNALLYPYYSAWGGILALITFSSFLNPEAEVTMLLYFIPIRMKSKYVAYIFIGFEIVFGLLSGYIGLIQSIANIVGALGGYLMLKNFNPRTPNPFVRARSRPF